MAAMAWPSARPNVLHPRQYGGINLERAYCIRRDQNSTYKTGLTHLLNTMHIGYNPNLNNPMTIFW
jgi:hypothetical protein